MGKDLKRDRKFVSQEDHELAYNKKNPSKRRGYKNVKKFESGGEVQDVAEAIFYSNSKKGKIETSFGDKTLQGLTSMIENDNYSPTEIANAIFYHNDKNNRIETGFGTKNWSGLLDMIKRARQGGSTYADGGNINDTISKLKKGDTIRISYGSVMSGNSEVELKVRSRNLVKKGKIDKITFDIVRNPSGVKFYAYDRLDGRGFSFAKGDMGISNVKIISKMSKGGNTDYFSGSTYAGGGYLYTESDDENAYAVFNSKKEVMEFIKEHNENFDENYKSIEDFNEGEEYRKITKIKQGGSTYEGGGEIGNLVNGGWGINLKWW